MWELPGARPGAARGTHCPRRPGTPRGAAPSAPPPRAPAPAACSARQSAAPPHPAPPAPCPGQPAERSTGQRSGPAPQPTLPGSCGPARPGPASASAGPAGSSETLPGRRGPGRASAEGPRRVREWGRAPCGAGLGRLCSPLRRPRRTEPVPGRAAIPEGHGRSGAGPGLCPPCSRDRAGAGRGCGAGAGSRSPPVPSGSPEPFGSFLLPAVLGWGGSRCGAVVPQPVLPPTRGRKEGTGKDVGNFQSCQKGVIKVLVTVYSTVIDSSSVTT